MGRKPVLGLAGLFLAGVTLTGCCMNGSCRNDKTAQTGAGKGNQAQAGQNSGLIGSPNNTSGLASDVLPDARATGRMANNSQNGAGTGSPYANQPLPPGGSPVAGQFGNPPAGSGLAGGMNYQQGSPVGGSQTGLPQQQFRSATLPSAGASQYAGQVPITNERLPGDTQAGGGITRIPTSPGFDSRVRQTGYTSQQDSMDVYPPQPPPASPAMGSGSPIQLPGQNYPQRNTAPLSGGVNTMQTPGMPGPGN